jgi:ATP-dependent Clp protease adaptor protein ClpS
MAAVFAPPKTGYNETMAKPHQHEGSVLEARRTKLVPPPLYTVLLLNDDFTPMDFVVHVLQKFFSMNQEQATQIMLKVHMEGRGVCGVYPRDVAATKVEQVLSFARENQHPLACIMEEN